MAEDTPKGRPVEWSVDQLQALDRRTLADAFGGLLRRYERALLNESSPASLAEAKPPLPPSSLDEPPLKWKVLVGNGVGLVVSGALLVTGWATPAVAAFGVALSVSSLARGILSEREIASDGVARHDLDRRAAERVQVIEDELNEDTLSVSADVARKQAVLAAAVLAEKTFDAVHPRNPTDSDLYKLSDTTAHLRSGRNGTNADIGIDGP